jgi:hemerythrin superfamily protein
MHMKSKMSGGWKWAILGGVGGTVAMISLLPTIRRRAMRVTTILKKDHRVVSGLLMVLEKTPRNAMLRTPLVDELYENITAHEHAEDDVVYSTIQDVGSATLRQEIRQARKGQPTIRELVATLRETDPESEEFDQWLAELKQNITEHAELEERSVFRYVEERISEERQFEMGQRLHELKARLLEEHAA